MTDTKIIIVYLSLYSMTAEYRAYMSGRGVIAPVIGAWVSNRIKK
jgi:hypothetical protein